MENSLNLNSAYYYNVRSLSTIISIIGTKKSKFAHVFNSMDLTNFSQVAKLISEYIFFLQGIQYSSFNVRCAA